MSALISAAWAGYPYPVKPMEISRHLGYSLGCAVSFFICAPYRDGPKDCARAIEFIGLEQEAPFTLPEGNGLLKPCQRLIEYLTMTPGDPLWLEIAHESKLFLINLSHYAAGKNHASLPQMADRARSLWEILTLRDAKGQFYQGMSGLPVRGDENE